MIRIIFADPRHNRSANLGGPRFIEGWVLPDGSRYFNRDRSLMWFAETKAICQAEGLNYEGHKI